MAAVTRLVTLVETVDDGDDPRRMSVSLRHEAVLSDGRRLLLLDDRGWTWQLMEHRAEGDAVVDGDVSDIWDWTSVEDIEETARLTVGPDEPFDDRTPQDMQAGHWAYLAGTLDRLGVSADAQALRGLPHDVVLSEQLRARVRGRS